jgi:(4S)-4-hydroxy-5-phosphonooxypentane-2,3-dione isomerase
MYAVTVLFKINEGRRDQFLPLMIENARLSLQDEPGCHQFDVCTDPARPDDVFLYEIYDDVAAFKAHLQMPHFKSFDANVSEMIDEKTVWTFSEVAS